MKDRFTNLILIAALAEQAACNPIKPVKVEPSPKVTTFVPTESIPMILTPTVVPTEILPTPTPALEERFKFGEFDMAKTSFTISTTEELQSILGHIANTNRTLNADIPLPIITSDFGDPEQNKTFEKAAHNHSQGNPYFLSLTDQPNHLFALFHSMQLNAPGDLAREIGGYVYKHPENTDKILGLKIPMSLPDGITLDVKIVFVNTVSKEFFQNEEENLPWGIYEDKDNILFARTDQFGIPDSIRNDRTQGVYYLTIAGCQNINPGEISIDPFNPSKAYAKNTANRSLLTLKIVIPEN